MPKVPATPSRQTPYRRRGGRADRSGPSAGKQRAIEPVDVVEEALDRVARHEALPASPIRRRRSGSRASRRGGRPSRRRRRARRGSRPRRRATTSGTPPTRGRDHGPPPASASIATHRRALVGRGQEQRVEGGVVRRDVVLVAEEEARARRSRARGRAARRSRGRGRRRPGTAPRRRRGRGGGANCEQHVVDALDGGHAADPADDEAVRRDAEQRRAQPCASPSSDPTTLAASVDPEADDRELLGRRDAKRDEVVAHLGADGDQPVVACEPPARAGGRASVRSRAEVAAQDVAVEGVHDDRRPRVAGERARRAGRSCPPWPCACAGSAAAARRISPATW